MRLARRLSRTVFRKPLIIVRTELLLTLAVMGAVIIVQTANAESKTRSSKSTTTITTQTTESDEPLDESNSAPAQNAPAAAPAPVEEGKMTTTFGSKATTGTAGCKTHEQSEDVIRQLKTQCNNWLKERKAELKNKYNVGTCEDECNDCGMSLQRCTVTGTVFYKKN